MSTYKDCQSCGMPMKRDPQGGGTEAGGAKSEKYCSYCYQNGAFTAPDMTLAQMETLVAVKLKEMHYPAFLAKMFAKKTPQLERWTSAPIIPVALVVSGLETQPLSSTAPVASPAPIAEPVAPASVVSPVQQPEISSMPEVSETVSEVVTPVSPIAQTPVQTMPTDMPVMTQEIPVAEPIISTAVPSQVTETPIAPVTPTPPATPTTSATPNTFGNNPQI